MYKVDKKIVQGVAVGAVIVKDSKVLILQRHKNEKTYPEMWELPSGKKEPLETIESALIREAKEETGLDVVVEGIVSVFNYQVEKESEIRDVTQINFLAKIIREEKVVLSGEHQAFAWVGAGDLESYSLSEETKGVIMKALEK